MNTHSQRLYDKIYSIKQNIHVYRGDNWLKIHQKSKYVNDVKRYETFSSRNWYHKATAPISTVIFSLCPMSWRNVMELTQNWDNQNQQAKSFQMRYNWSKLNNQNYQTLMLWVNSEVVIDTCLILFTISKYNKNIWKYLPHHDKMSSKIQNLKYNASMPHG